MSVFSRAQSLTILGWGDSRQTFERPREMTLVAESCRQRDVYDRRFRSRQLMAGAFDPQLPHIITHRTAVGLMKRLRQVDRVDTNRLCNISQPQRLGKMCLEKHPW